MRWSRPLVLLAALACPLSGQAGLMDDDEARARIEILRRQVNERLEKLENTVADRSVMIELAEQVELLKAELAKARGQLEVLLNQLEVADKRQKDLYVDVDTRLRKLEQPTEASATATEKPAAPAVAEGAADTKLYEAALNQLKQGNYPLAISAFQGFLLAYPTHQLAPSAQYWMGNAHLQQREYKPAITVLQKLVSTSPDHPRAPDALLGVATAQEALGDRRATTKTLEQLIAKYASSDAAKTAKQRLQKK